MLSFFFPKIIMGIDAIWFLTAVLIFVGLVTLVVVALFVRKGTLRKDSLKYDIAKDLGIALLTAAIVTLVYDSVLDFRKLSDLFNIAFGSDVGEAVVDTVRPTVFQRELIRENADFIVRIYRDDALAPGQAIIKVDIGYDVYSLRTFGDKDYRFVQELESFNVRGKDKDGHELPRFEVVSISTREKPYEGEELQKMVDKGHLKLADPIYLKPWPNRNPGSEPKERSAVRITTRRAEIVNIPGSYNIVLGELTKGIRVRIMDHPADVNVEIKRWYTSRAQEFEKEGKDERYHPGVVLPGQSISLRFWKEESANAAPAQDAAPAASPVTIPTPAAPALQGARPSNVTKRRTRRARARRSAARTPARGRKR
jgi:hypothetical protein